MAKKPLHKQIKSALGQSPERPLEEDMWLDMQSRLKEDKEQRRLPAWLIFGLLSVLFVSVFILLPSENLSTERIENSISEKVVLRPKNEESSIIINSINNQKEIQVESIEKLSGKIITKVIEASISLNAKLPSKSENESLAKGQISDNELIKSRSENFIQAKKDILLQNNKEHFALNKMLVGELMPLPSLLYKVIEEQANIEQKIPDIHFGTLSLMECKDPKFQVGIFTGKTYSYLGLPTLTLVPDEARSSKIHFGLSTLFNLNQNLKIGFNLHYKKEMYSHFSNWADIPATSTHFVSRTDSAPNLLGLGLNLTYYPLKNRAISPYMGLGIQQDLKLQDKRIYYFSPSFYSPDLSEYSETKNLKGEVLRTRTTLMKLGTEVKLSPKIQIFGECLRHLPLEKENVYSYKWSWRAGILFNLKQQ